ncbi:MAG: CoxG family protein [Candidatus Bipolaricaulia bacterium]
MKLDGSYTVNAPLDRVWNALNDPELLIQCIPGCRQLELESEGRSESRYRAMLELGLTDPKGQYTGWVEISDKVPNSHCRLSIEATGNPGPIQIIGIFDLEGLADKTHITYTGEVQVSGKIAGFGDHMISGIAKLVINQFFKTMDRELSR